MFLIRCGNHYLQCGHDPVDAKWVDLGNATLHSEEWADNFIVIRLLGEPAVHCEKILFDDAIAAHRNRALEAVKNRWLCRFAGECHRLFCDFSSDGMWVNAHMFYSQKISVEEALKKFETSGISMRKKSDVVKIIKDKIKEWGSLRPPLSDSDWKSVEATILQLLDEKWDNEDIFRFCTLMEEVNPNLSEAYALKEMQKIRDKYSSSIEQAV